MPKIEDREREERAKAAKSFLVNFMARDGGFIWPTGAEIGAHFRTDGAIMVLPLQGDDPADPVVRYAKELRSDAWDDPAIADVPIPGVVLIGYHQAVHAKLQCEPF